MQKAGELELRLKCSMKMLSHLFSRKIKSSRAVFAVEHMSTNHFLTASFVFYPIFTLRGREKEKACRQFFSHCQANMR